MALLLFALILYVAHLKRERDSLREESYEEHQARMYAEDPDIR